MDKLLELFLTFFKIGALSFGGGYAMIPFLQSEASAHGWLTVSEFADIVAVSQITPGPVAVNMATFVGYRMAGGFGAFFATLGVCLPSFVMMSILIRFFIKFAEAPTVKHIFSGLRPAVIGLILAAACHMGRLEFFQTTVPNIKGLIVCAVAFTAMLKWKVSPVLCIIAAAFAGVMFF